MGRILNYFRSRYFSAGSSLKDTYAALKEIFEIQKEASFWFCWGSQDLTFPTI